jgi:hypothetical protein
MTNRRKTRIVITLDVLTQWGADIPAGADRKFIEALVPAVTNVLPRIESAIEKQYNNEFLLGTQFRVTSVALDESEGVYSDQD